MRRITNRDLEALVDRINEITGSPKTPWETTKDGKNKANIDNYHLDGAYGGCRLVRHMNENGGIHVIIEGFTSKRELFNKLHVFADGIALGRKLK